MAEVSLVFLSKFTGKNWTDEDFEKVDVEKEMTDAFTTKLKAAEKKGWDESASKVKAQVYDEVEKLVSEKLGVDKAKVSEMIDDFKSKQPSKEISQDDIKNSDIFKNAVKKLSDKIEAIERDNVIKVKQFKDLEIDRVLQKKLDDIGTVKGWDFSNKMQLDFFIKGLKGDYTFDIDEKGKEIVLKDGQPVRDELQNDLSLGDIISNNGEKFFSITKDHRQAPENKPSSSHKIEPFKDANDYYDRVSAETDPDKLAAMKQQYLSQSKN